GSPGAKAGTNYDKGAVYIFTSAGGWTQQAKLVDPVEASETFFGCAVDISDDGNTVIIGSCSNPYINQMISSVYIYVRQNGNWSLQKKQLRGNDTQADDGFGGTVALSGDGNTTLVGAAMATVNMNNDRGAAYVFVRNGTTWAQQQTALSGTCSAMLSISPMTAILRLSATRGKIPAPHMFFQGTQGAGASRPS
ncbi:MAG: hypothetical protein Q8R42_04125, partial [Desulfocapsaceae bacterium]|nr:hypothetical protein [Desulfocapsaceae bacterium]